VYPAETFERKKKYGLTMLVSSDTGLTDYLSNVFQQISGATLSPSPLELTEPTSKRRENSPVCGRWAC
jgi:hypothetical protein